MSAAPQLSITPITTSIFRQGQNLVDFIIDQTPPNLIQEGIIIAITSKIVSLAEHRLIERSSISKAALIQQEADYNLGEVAYGSYLTIKQGLFIPSAGIDESNSEQDQYILYPLHPFVSAKALWEGLRRRWNLRTLGILMTDSHTTPLRRGVTGISLAHWGFQGLTDLIGTPDLFGRKMKMTTVNVADALATAATLMMGEANECRPLALIRASEVVFVDETDALELKMPVKEDLYYPFFKNFL